MGKITVGLVVMVMVIGFVVSPASCEEIVYDIEAEVDPSPLQIGDSGDLMVQFKSQVRIEKIHIYMSWKNNWPDGEPYIIDRYYDGGFSGWSEYDVGSFWSYGVRIPIHASKSGELFYDIEIYSDDGMEWGGEGRSIINEIGDYEVHDPLPDSSSDTDSNAIPITNATIIIVFALVVVGGIVAVAYAVTRKPKAPPQQPPYQPPPPPPPEYVQ